MRINFAATHNLLERIRSLGTCPKWVMTSSVAVFGGELPEQVEDHQVWAPQSSYGTQKAMNDLLLADYSRRGFVDGRSLRMPTIVVRPGKPNMAASSFASGIIREPLNGQESVCPVPLDTRLWLMSPAQAIANLIHGHELSAEQLKDGRVINMPGLSIRVEQMIDAQQGRRLLQIDLALAGGNALEAEFQIAPHGEVREKTGFLKHVAERAFVRRDENAPVAVLPDVAVDRDEAAGSLFQPGDATQAGGLAGPGMAIQRRDAAPRQRQVDVHGKFGEVHVQADFEG